VGFLATESVGALMHSAAVWCHCEFGCLRLGKSNLLDLFRLLELKGLLWERNLSNLRNVRNPDAI
jgi:hypothetical protein